MTTLVVVLASLFLVAALRLWSTANRLDRLHVRTEAAWAALDGALSRRIVATRAAAAAGAFPGPAADRLRRLTRSADHADLAHRADAENDLSRALGAQPAVIGSELAAELTDAGERVALARRLYNDAVRDTRALRAVWFTRLFLLAGRAALPDYFEIADHAAIPASPRLTARLLLFDDAGRVLLFSGSDPQGRRIWFPTGGGVEPGEDLRQAALRELAEETGLQADRADLLGPIWRRTARFGYAGVDYEQSEFFFVVQAAPGFSVDVRGFSPVETDSITGYRWFSGADLLAATDAVQPVELGRRFGEALQVLAHGIDPDSVVEIT